MNNVKILCKYYGGSLSYGLQTPTSDLDIRGVNISTKISQIIGLEKYQQTTIQNSQEDTQYFEFKHFMNLLRNGNTQALEMMFNEEWLEISPEFKYVQSFKTRLIDSHKLYKCLKGYCQSERRLVLGERTGVLGGKRREHLEKYGYSYKNLVQYLRLCLAGAIFFDKGYFPVNIRPVEIYGNLLFDIKVNPQNYTKEQAINLMDEFERIIDKSYNNIKVIYNYDENLANELCLRMYYPILKEHYGKLTFANY